MGAAVDGRAPTEERALKVLITLPFFRLDLVPSSFVNHY